MRLYIYAFLVEDDKCSTDIGFRKRSAKPIKTDLSEEELKRRARRNECKLEFRLHILFQLSFSIYRP